MITIKALHNQVEPAPAPVFTQTPEPIRPEPIAIKELPAGNDELDKIHAQAKIAKRLGATVSITGKWVWASFSSIPAAATRDTLKANHWIWCKGKGKWAYRGAPSHSRKQMPWDYITNKYGEEVLEGGN